MKIKVKLFATLRKDRFDEKELEVYKGADIDFLLKELKLERSDVPIIFINGKHAEHDSLIVEGDEIALFPPIGGG